MNSYSENTLQAIDILWDEYQSRLLYDKTIQATIYSLVNLDTGEYKVRYNGNVFSAYAENLNENFKKGDSVYVIVPEGDFSNRKIISHKITNHSLSAALLTELSNSIVEVSPTFEELGYGYETGKGQDDNGIDIVAGELVAGLHKTSSIFENSGLYEASSAHQRFQLYANLYEYIRILGSFLTSLFEDHSKGSYGLEVCFYAKSEDGLNLTEATYYLNFNSFVGDPYRLSVYSPQSVIIKTLKNYLLGLKYIRFYEEQFDYDHYIENGEVTTNKVYNSNLFVKDIQLLYVDVKDLSDARYYLTIAASKGISFTDSLTSLDLVGVLIYDHRNILDSSTCVCKWFKRDLKVMVGAEEYDKEAGFGWAPITTNNFNELTVNKSEVGIDLRYKLIVNYNDTTTLTSEITLFNPNYEYGVELEQTTEGDNIYLLLKKNKGTGDLLANWYYSNPDGSYSSVSVAGIKKDTNYLAISPVNGSINVITQLQDQFIYNIENVGSVGGIENAVAFTFSEDASDTVYYMAAGSVADLLAKGLNHIPIKDYLIYSSVTFYSEVYVSGKSDFIITSLEHVVNNSESEEDVVISYTGEESFRYDANGDITIEDSEKERTLQVHLAWKDGVGSAYKLEWLKRDGNGYKSLANKSASAEKAENKLDSSMIEKLWVDNSNILHYTIKLKYKVSFNNNTIYIRITTVDEKVYTFAKEILFVKDGDLGTNGTTYVIALRPSSVEGSAIEPNHKLSGFLALLYNGSKWTIETMGLGCYVYKDGELINNNSTKYEIKYKWRGVGVQLTTLAGGAVEDYTSNDRVKAKGVDIPRLAARKETANLVYYVRVEALITEKESLKTFNIYSLYPIDVIYGPLKWEKDDFDTSSLPSYVQYTSSGLNPSFYSNDLNIYFKDEKIASKDKIISRNTALLDLDVKNDGRVYLVPASSFIFENVKSSDGNIGAIEVAISSDSYLIHSIVMYLNTFGNESINGWDGTAVEVNENDGYVFAPQIGAGTKDSNNRFSGVIMGKDSGLQDKNGNYRTGLYGYQAGENTFGFMENGTAFLGKQSGGGRIYMDGNSAIIAGGTGAVFNTDGSITYTPEKANGMVITLASKKNSDYAIQVGNNIFTVNYLGTVVAENATVNGTLYAGAGSRIGGTKNDNNGWTIATHRLYSGSNTNYVALDSGSEGENYAIWAGNQTSTNAPFRVSRSGIVTMTGATIKGDIYAKSGYIGCSYNSETGTYSEDGWVITQHAISNLKDGSDTTNYVKLSTDGTYAILAGKVTDVDTTVSSLTTTAFSVTHAGKLRASEAVIAGGITAKSGTIGNWKINTSNNMRLESRADGTHIYLNGDAKGDDKALYVGYTSNLSALNDDGYSNSGNGFCYITANGKLYAQNAEIRGVIKSNNGLIGTWYIDTNKLSSIASTATTGSSTVGMARFGMHGCVGTVSTGYSTPIANIAFWAGMSYNKGGYTVTGGTSGTTYNLAGSSSGTYFAVTSSGNLYCRNANILGTIISTSGNLGGWELSTNGLYYKGTGTTTYTMSNSPAYIRPARSAGDSDSTAAVKLGNFYVLRNGAIYISNDNGSTKPFEVTNTGIATLAGSIRATSLILGSGNNKRSVFDGTSFTMGSSSDSDSGYMSFDTLTGKLTLSGAITLGRGSSITWTGNNAVNTPPNMETTNGAQNKADDALSLAKSYTNNLINNLDIPTEALITEITQNSIKTASILANLIAAGTIKGMKIWTEDNENNSVRLSTSGITWPGSAHILQKGDNLEISTFSGVIFKGGVYIDNQTLKEYIQSTNTYAVFAP